MTITRVIDGICRAEGARVLSGLIGRFRDFDLAEDEAALALVKNRAERLYVVRRLAACRTAQDLGAATIAACRHLCKTTPFSAPACRSRPTSRLCG